MDEVEAVLRNVSVKEEMWLSLISELESDANPAYFVGTSLRRWRMRQVYSTPLVTKLRSRAKLAYSSRRRARRTHETYFCLSGVQAQIDWRKFLEEDVLMVPNANLDDYGLFVIALSSDTPYSAVCGSSTLAVTPYTATRNVDESLSVFFRRRGNFYRLYTKDIQKTISAASNAT